MSLYPIPSALLEPVPNPLSADKALELHTLIVDTVDSWSSNFPPSVDAAGRDVSYLLPNSVARRVEAKTNEVVAYLNAFSRFARTSSGNVTAEVRARILEEVGTLQAYAGYLRGVVGGLRSDGGLTIGNRVGFWWSAVWPYVFAGAAVLGAGFYWYKTRPKNAKPVFGLFGTPKRRRRSKKRRA